MSDCGVVMRCTSVSISILPTPLCGVVAKIEKHLLQLYRLAGCDGRVRHFANNQLDRRRQRYVKERARLGDQPFIFTGCRRASLRRPKASIWSTRSRARSPARRISSRSRADGLSDASCALAISACPRIAPIMLLKLCATPLARDADLPLEEDRIRTLSPFRGRLGRCAERKCRSECLSSGDAAATGSGYRARSQGRRQQSGRFRARGGQHVTPNNPPSCQLDILALVRCASPARGSRALRAMRARRSRCSGGW